MAANPVSNLAPERQRAGDGHSIYDGVRMSYAEFLKLPGEKPSLEYVDGRVVQKAVARRAHGKLQLVIGSLMLAYANHVGGEALTETDVDYALPGDPMMRVPDVSYWAPGRDRGDYAEPLLPPTLAIEVRSPGETLASQRRKCVAMRARGAEVCWLFDPSTRTVIVFEGEPAGALFGGTILTSTHLPGFELDLPALWACLD